MRCEDFCDRLPDRLDDLLDADESARVDAHRDLCPSCADRAREVERTRAVLFAKPEVGPPPSHLRGSILAAASTPRRPWISSLLRYAAVFLAGVGATLAFSPEPRVIEVPLERVVVESPAPSAFPVIDVAAPRIPRRIR